MARIFIKNWRDFQHYKDRNPTWIKLHKKFLDDFEFHGLPLASRALAPMLWLLASESLDGSIDYNVDKIAFRLRTTKQEIKDAIEPLLSSSFIYMEQDASKTLADGYSETSPEKRREETEKSREDASGNGKKTNESENLEPPPDSEELILAIAKAHPDSGSVKGNKVPYLLQQQIISAIVSDSEELELTPEAATQRILDLTRKYAETKRKFTWGINKFFEHRKYNLDSREWGGPESNFVPADTTKRESLLDITKRALRS